MCVVISLWDDPGTPNSPPVATPIPRPRQGGLAQGPSPVRTQCHFWSAEVTFTQGSHSWIPDLHSEIISGVFTLLSFGWFVSQQQITNTIQKCKGPRRARARVRTQLEGFLQSNSDWGCVMLMCAFLVAQRQRISLPCRSHRRCGLNPWMGKIPCRRAWQPLPVFLPGESHGQRSLAGHSPRGCEELGTTERLSTQAPRCWWKSRQMGPKGQKDGTETAPDPGHSGASLCGKEVLKIKCVC